ncbi:MAG: hypothetical protein OXJ52_01275 [Oligoflexia bacterium]|nr:hypothetical protein [Oligoflexia bacterium]
MRLLFIVLFLVGCSEIDWSDFSFEKVPTWYECPYTDLLQDYERAGLKECNKEALIRDIEDMTTYVEALIEMGEHYDEPYGSVPNSLKKTKAVYCFDHCGAMSWFQRKCHLHNSSFRKTWMYDKVRASKEPVGCTKLFEGRKATGKILDFRWRNHPKYKEFISGKCGRYISCK